MATRTKMSLYTSIDWSIWYHPDFEPLTSDQKFMVLYLLTCPKRNILGLFQISRKAIAQNMKFAVKRVNRILRELSDLGYVFLDSEQDYILNVQSTVWYPLRTPQSVKAAYKQAALMPPTFLFRELLRIYNGIRDPELMALLNIKYSIINKKENGKPEINHLTPGEGNEQMALGSHAHPPGSDDGVMGEKAKYKNTTRKGTNRKVKMHPVIRQTMERRATPNCKICQETPGVMVKDGIEQGCYCTKIGNHSQGAIGGIINQEVDAIATEIVDQRALHERTGQ